MLENSGQKVAILCVEDVSTNRYFRRLILEQHGYRVFAAGSAEEALQVFTGQHVDLLLTDEQLGRDSGEALAAEVKRLRPEVPVLMLGATSAPSATADKKLDVTTAPVDLLHAIEEAVKAAPKVDETCSLRPAEDALPDFPVDSEPETVRSLLAEIVESSDDAILSKTLDGTVTSWNRAAAKMYGYTAQEIVGRNISLLLPPDRPNEVHEILTKLQKGEKLDHFETRRKTKDGRILDVSLTISPVRDRHGRIVGASTIARDVTELRAAQAALRNSEKLAVAGRMAATVAHEINNPLEAVANILYLLKQERSLSDMARQFVKTGEEELKRITQIARTTLGFHRDRVVTMSSVNIPEMLEGVLTLFQRKLDTLGARVEKEFDSRGEVLGNSGELRQVFSNLIVNAIEALSQSGDLLRIRVKHGSRRGVQGIVVSIADNGPGISADARRRLFEPFFTTKGAKGTGIGLWVSQGIVAKHGGSIRLKSRKSRRNSGTVFSIFLPYKDGKSSQNPKERRAVERPLLRRAS